MKFLPELYILVNCMPSQTTPAGSVQCPELQLKGGTWCRTFVAMPHGIAQILDVNPPSRKISDKLPPPEFYFGCCGNVMR
jgi:hypothetical protein